MRKGILIAWACWLACGIALKILGTISSWFVALSALWFPLAVTLSGVGVLLLIAEIGARLKRREEARAADACENCLFGSTCDLINSMRGEGEEKVKCIGEERGVSTRPNLCEYYIRSKKA